MKILNSKNEEFSHLTQWDINRKLKIEEYKVEQAPMFHFYNEKSERALVVPSKLDLQGNILVDIPNKLTQQPYDLIVAMFITTEKEGQTEEIFEISMERKAKPEDYNYEENIEYTNWVELSEKAKKQIAEMQGIIDDVQNKLDTGAFKGDKGDTGNGIKLIEKVGKIGLETTYRIIFTDGNSFNYVVTDGYTPVKGKDYYTETEKQDFVNEILEDSTNKFNTNVVEKTNAFNENSNTKTSEFNINASNKTSDFNANSEVKTTEYDNNASDKLKSYNDNDLAKIEAYNSNATSKLNAYNKNDETKLKAYNDNHTTKLNEYNSNAKTKTDEFNSIASDYDERITENTKNIASNSKRLKTLETNIFDSGVASGENINIKDSALAEFQEIKSSINKAQETTTGANLLAFPYTGIQVGQTIYRNGIAFTCLKDGGIKLNGNISGDTAYIDIGEMDLGEKSISTTRGLEQATNGLYTISKYMYYRPSDKLVFANIYDPEGLKPTINETIYPMVNKGTKLLPYEPYTGGIASPNPDYPREIATIKENWETVSCGKNLLNPATFIEGKVPSISTGEIVNYPGAGYYSAFIKFDKNYGNYFTIKYLNGASETSYILGYDKDKKFISRIKNVTNEYYVSPSSIPNDIEYLRIRVDGYENTTDAMVVNGNKIPYEPYQSISTLNDLKGNEFLPGDNIIKRFNVEDGKYWAYLEKNMGKYIFTGDEEWGNDALTTEYQYFFIRNNELVNAAKNNTFTCNYFSKGYWREKKPGYDATSVFILIIKLSTFGGVDGETPQERRTKFKAWLKGKNVVAIYGLPDNQKEVIPIAPLDQMNMTYNPETNLFSSIGNIKIEAKYYREFATTIRNMQIDNGKLQEQLNDMEKRIVALENRPVVVNEPVEEVTNA